MIFTERVENMRLRGHSFYLISQECYEKDAAASATLTLSEQDDLLVSTVFSVVVGEFETNKQVIKFLQTSSTVLIKKNVFALDSGASGRRKASACYHHEKFKLRVRERRSNMSKFMSHI